MIVLLFKFIFLAITLSSNLISLLIFHGTANILVLFINAFKVPGEAMQGGLEYLADVFRACFDFILGIVMEILGSIASYVFDLVKDAVLESASTAGSTIGDLVEKTRDSLGGMLNDYFPEILEGFSEMGFKIVKDLLKNYVDAFGYVVGND